MSHVLLNFTLSSGLVLKGNYGNEGLVLTLAGELYGSVYKGVKSVIFTHADVEARIVGGTPLAYDDVAGLYDLFAELLDAESLGMGLTTVLGT
jgi:hypothetical protein